MGGYVTRTPVALPLLNHPNFNIPDVPETSVTPATFNKIVEWTLESVASFISPSPKEDDEDEEFACDDIAKVLREDMPEILKVDWFRDGMQVGE